MTKLLDREYQRDLLTSLAASYPGRERLVKEENATIVSVPDDRVRVNIAYLQEHGLIEADWRVLNQRGNVPLGAKITAKGIDFIADDGGLSAILDVVTVKLHEDTIKSLLVSQIAASSADPSIKEQLISEIKRMPANALGKLSERIIEAGLKNIPDALDWLREAVNSLPTG